MSLHGKEDIYESEDLPESDQVNDFIKEEVNDPEHLELVHIDIDAAKKRFEGRILNCKDVDFSDSIAKKRLKAYGSSAYVLEIVGREYEQPETPEQKFNRLTFEINELADMIKDQNVTPTGIMTDSSINQLLDELKDVRVAKICGQTIQVKQEDRSERKNVKLNDDKLLSLEQRISRIESLIGPIDSTRQPIVDAVEDLRFRTEAFNPAYIEGMEIRLNSIITKLEQVGCLSNYYFKLFFMLDPYSLTSFDNYDFL
uniref:Uncharacterized protein n=1 Tax=Heterorhabditis bacteriophora TaxID=37862 RepID=A0A1I7WC11_HETBA